MSNSILQRIQEVQGEITAIMEGMQASYMDTEIDNLVYIDRPSSTDHLHFQLHAPMSDYRSALTYLESQLIKAKAYHAA